MKAKLLKYSAGLFIAALTFGLQISQAQDAAPADSGTPPPAAPDQGNPPPPPQHGDHFGGDHFKFLTPAEQAQYKKDREAAFAANPDLKAQFNDLRSEGKALHSDENATPEDKQTFGEKFAAFQKTLDDAILKVDASAQPILDKIAAHRKNHQPG